MRQPRTRISGLRYATIFAGVVACLAPPSTMAAKGHETRSRAREARTIALVENARLRAAPHAGNAIHEEGSATGTYNCKITVDIRIVSTNRVIASFVVRPPGGTVSGNGSARFVTKGAYGYVGGELSITRGSGKFAHASGAAIGFSGKFNRETLSATIQVHGNVHV